MTYRNADGSIAEMCGNGRPVLARYMLAHGLVEGPACVVGHAGGLPAGLPGGEREITATWVAPA